jgi:excisionase family DNA binding protein
MAERPSHDLDRMTVAQAAEALGISQDAVRKRIARGTIRHDRDESNRVHVYLAPSETVHQTDQDTTPDAASKTVQDAYVRSLEDQVRFLREELERKDAILLNLTERIPQLEAPRDARGSPTEDASQQPGTLTPPEAETGGERRPWWRRVFGG